MRTHWYVNMGFQILQSDPVRYVTETNLDKVQFTSYDNAGNVPIRLDGKRAPALGGLGFSNPHTIAG